MNGRIPGFQYDPKKHIATFSLFQPKSKGKIRRQRTVRAATRDEAVRLWQEFRDELRAAADAPEQPPTDAAQPHGLMLTFAAFVETYLERICARKARKTFTTYRTIATTRLVPFFGAFSLDVIRSCDIEDFMVVTLQSGCTPAYTNNCVRTMKALLGHDVASAHFAAPRKFGFGPNPESDATGYRYARFRALKPVFVVALETGLRKMDLLNLQWSQVDLAQGFIRVQMQKTKKFAVIPISQLCRDALDECRRRSVESRYVCVTLEGKRVPEITVRRAFARVKRLAGITRRFRFHDLRHTAASSLAASVPL